MLAFSQQGSIAFYTLLLFGGKNRVYGICISAPLVTFYTGEVRV